MTPSGVYLCVSRGQDQCTGALRVLCTIDRPKASRARQFPVESCWTKML